MQTAIIVAWLVPAMLQWTAGHGKGPAREAYLATIAGEALEVLDEPGESPFYGDAAKTAAVTLAFASQESGFNPRIQAGDCKPWECDGGKDGRAAGFGQVHAYGGLALGEDGLWTYLPERSREWIDANPARIFRKADLVGDDPMHRKNNLRAMMHMLRKARAGGFCGYTGEPGPCPKAALRRGLADRWIAAHPLAQ